MVSLLDHNIGILLNTLKKLGLSDNTRIIYTSDHGELLGNHGMWGKMCFHEESVAIPFIASGNDIPKGKKRKCANIAC
jgi:choline-sulfatase